ncbi:MAG: alkaline phosphatase family protein, partial [Myxococcota bacterium]
MTPDVRRRWSVLLWVAVASCTEPRATVPEPPKVVPDEPRLVVLVVPGLDRETLDEVGARSLSALRYQSELEPPAPAHPQALWATLYAGVPPSDHGVFDGTARQPNSYSRVARASSDIARVESGVVRPARFASAPSIDPYWTSLTQAGVDATVLFAPNAMPPVESKARFLAGALPAVNGRRPVATLFVKPGQAPAPPTRLVEAPRRRASPVAVAALG